MEECYFNQENRCAILTKKRCAKCHFRKTKRQLDEGRRKALDRVDSLPDGIRCHIIRKYYSGGE